MEYVEYVECVEYQQSGTVCDGESVEKGVGCFDFGNSSRGVLGGVYEGDEGVYDSYWGYEPYRVCGVCSEYVIVYENI